MESTYYLTKIKEHFSKKQRSNPSYSLRAYARDLDLPASTLSQILLGNRSLPLKRVSQVLEKIDLSPKERTLFMDSLNHKKSRLDEIQVQATDQRFILDETYYQIISEWEHYASLMLFDCQNFNLDVNSLSKRLNISKIRAEVVINNLIKYGMIKTKKNGKFIRTHSKFRTTEDVASQALKMSHRETLEISKQKLEEIRIDLRDFSSMMVAINMEQLTEAKIIIREFREKMLELLKNNKCTQVYQLAIQFYPLTQLQNIKEKN